MTSSRPPERERQARRMRAVNLFMRPILALPFRTPLSGSLMLAHLTGCRSGRHYRVPLSYVRDGDALLTPGGGRWKLNLQADTSVRLQIAGRSVEAVPELISDPGEVTRLLDFMDANDSRVLAFSGIERLPDGSLNQAQVDAAVRGGFRIVRWRPAAAG